jgi:hypothetical protein
LRLKEFCYVYRSDQRRNTKQRKENQQEERAIRITRKNYTIADRPKISNGQKSADKYKQTIPKTNSKTMPKNIVKNDPKMALINVEKVGVKSCLKFD